MNTRFAAGDESAVRLVIARYGGAVQTIARSMMSEPELVSEVVQQTFIKAWRASSTFEPDRDMAPWLYAIARRTAIDVLRRERRPTQGGHDQETDVAVFPVSFEQTWERYEVRRAIDLLSPEEREVTRLSHLMGIPHSEIARRLGIPVGTVKSRLHRAHRRLAVTLGHLDDSVIQNPDLIVREGEDTP